MRRSWILLLLATSFRAFGEAPTAPSAEEVNGCGDSPDIASAEQVCGVYREVESFFGKYALISPGTNSPSNYSREPELCKAYYTIYFRARNVLCAYRKEAQELRTALEQRPRLPRQGDPPLSSAQVSELLKAGENYDKAGAMHKKYLDLLAKYELQERRAFQVLAPVLHLSSFMGGPAEAERSYERMVYFLLNTEKNCKGGSISNIPALWWGGVNRAYGRILKQTHPQIAQAIADAKKIAQEASSAWNGLESATRRAAGGMGRVRPPAVGDANPPPGTAPHVPHHMNAGLELAGHAAVDKGVHTLAHLLEVTWGPAKILSFMVTMGYIGAVNHGHVNHRDVIAAAIGVFSLPAGLLTAAMNVIIARDEEHRAVYIQYARWKLAENKRLTPQQLSSGFCSWYKENEHKQLKDALPAAQLRAGQAAH